MNKKTLIFIPTYNEAGNVSKLYHHIKKVNQNLDILFLDDDSPDGTGKILDDLAVNDENLFVIHRKEKLGIGSAHKEGIYWAYDKGYEILITMDSDYSHSPEDIPSFLDLANSFDVIVGTRFIRNDGMGELPLLRKILSLIAHFMTKSFLKLPFDCTNGYRLYRLDNIPKDLFAEIKSHSYSFFFESLFIIHNRKLRIEEIAIKLGGRFYGDSNMSMTDSLLSIKMLIKLVKEKYL